jgi:cytidine deaminase
MGIRNLAVFEYEEQGRLVRWTGSSARGRGHAERLVWQELAAKGVQPSQVVAIYSELEPCVLPGGYCRLWLARTFPNAKVTYSFSYGADVRSRMRGLEELTKNAARLEAQRGSV